MSLMRKLAKIIEQDKRMSKLANCVIGTYGEIKIHEVSGETEWHKETIKSLFEPGGTKFPSLEEQQEEGFDDRFHGSVVKWSLDGENIQTSDIDIHDDLILSFEAGNGQYINLRDVDWDNATIEQNIKKELGDSVEYY